LPLGPVEHDGSADGRDAMARLLRIVLVVLALSLAAGTVTSAAPCEPAEFGCP